MTTYKPDTPPTYRLTPKQKRILEAAALGLQLKEIGELHGIKLFTVREHLVRIRKRLGARNTTHAVAIAMKMSLISIEYPSSMAEALRCLEYLQKYIKDNE